MIKTKYVRTNKRKVFKQYYLLGSFLCVFAIFSALGITYKDKELSRAQWRGVFLGGIQIPALFLLWKVLFVDLFKASMTVGFFGLAVMAIAYIFYLIMFSVKYVTE